MGSGVFFRPPPIDKERARRYYGSGLKKTPDPLEIVMSTRPRLVGVELYFDNLPAARRFYQDTLGLELLEDEPGHHAKLEGRSAFICLERKGAESYPSQDKAVVFFEVDDLRSTVEQIGVDQFAGFGPKDQADRIPWAVIHDPEGHSVLLVQAGQTNR